MTALATSSLVKHVSLGVGKVVAVEPTAVHVFFPDAEKRFAAKLRLPAASTLLTSDGVEPNAWLQGLTSFAFDIHTGRYALAANFLSHDDALAEFLQVFPGGFLDPAYVGNGTGRRDRASRWRAASAEWKQTMGGGEGERLLAEGDIAELSKRALRIGGLVTPIAGLLELEALAEALEPADVVKDYYDALFALLGAPLPTRARIERVFATTEALGGDPDQAWPLATLFPFLADPGRSVVLVPKLANGAAARLGCDLKMKPSPNWASYAALRELSNQLLEKLRPNGARDHIDVEGFLHSIATRRPAVEADRAAPSEGSKPSIAPVRARRVSPASPAARRKR